MKKAYFDCFAGVSGDMIIGAFLDAGFNYSLLENELAKLNLPGYTISYTRCLKNGISATKFDVSVSSDHPPRSFPEITDLIIKSSLDPLIKNNVISIFNIIGRAEAKIHNTEIEKIHFHEIGAVDSIIDICGAAICFHHSAIEIVNSSPLNTGSGFIKTAHGTLPVPAPGTAEILKNMPAFSSGIMTELTTPTGAAIIKHFCSKYTPLPEIRADSIGYGAGTKNLEIPNVLRIFIGDELSCFSFNDEVTCIEANIDNMNAEIYSYLFDILTADGAVDISVIPATMKKNRPGHILKILAPVEKSDRITETVFRETTTSGVRISNVKRKILEKNFSTVTTKFGAVRVKTHILNGRIITIAPEYEDCKKAALEYKVSLKEVYNEALILFQGSY